MDLIVLVTDILAMEDAGFDNTLEEFLCSLNSSLSKNACDINFVFISFYRSFFFCLFSYFRTNERNYSKGKY